MVTYPTTRVQVLNSRFDPLTLSSTADDVMQAVRNGQRGWLATVNVAILMMMRESPELQSFADRARWVVADGQPVVWLSRVLGHPLPVRVAGIDVVDELCGRAEREGVTVFILGASSEVITRAAAEIQKAHPRLNLHYADGYFEDP
ncbi:MAG: glycosyl transferase, WecB/TagA/CpsF family, partial [Pseudarthrobacter sp.]|nr:glycosyl transferase, WecB/TagA/CpsF family [Pseudarthrobacter sp.]